MYIHAHIFMSIHKYVIYMYIYFLKVKEGRKEGEGTLVPFC